MNNNKKDEDAIVFDRDTSAPKNKMRNQSARRRQVNNDQSNSPKGNNQIKQVKIIEPNEDAKKEEEEEEEVEEEIEEEVEEEEEPKNVSEKKVENQDIKKDEIEEEKDPIKEDRKVDKKESDSKLVNQIKKNETINSNNKSSNSIINKSNNSIINKSNNSINNKSNSINNKSNNSMSSRNNSHNSKKNLVNNNNIINKNSNKNLSDINKKNSSCQVNLFTDDENAKFIQTLKMKINNLTKEKQKLMEQANASKKNYEEQIAQKKQEIMSLSQINAKLRINLEKVSSQVNKLLDKVEKKNNIQKSGSTTNLENNNKRSISSALNKYKLKEKINESFSNEENKDKGAEIQSLKEKLNMKESQLKNSLSLIEFLRKDNKKLKMLSESFGNENLENNNINNYKLIEEIKKKNKEIKQLEKAYKEIVSIKTPDKELEYYKNQVLQLKEANSNNEATIKKLRLTISQIKNKEDKKLNYPNSPIISAKYKLDNNDSKTGKNSQNNKEQRSSSVINSYDWRNSNLNNNFGKLLNEKEKKALFKLFESEEEYKNFNKKLNVIDNHYNAIGKRYENTINELKETIKDKEEQISYLREKIRENEMKIKILLNKFHLERQKNDKNVVKQQGQNSTKTITKSS